MSFCYNCIIRGRMYTHPHGFHTLPPKQLNQTASTWISREECNYLTNVNYKLVVPSSFKQNEINQSEAEKHFYKTKLAYQSRTHYDQLQEAFQIINEKNTYIIDLEEKIDVFKKDLRAAADDYLSLQRNSEANKEYLQCELVNAKAAYEEKLKKYQQESERKYELKVQKRVEEVQKECSERIKLYTDQIDLLTQNSKSLSHELLMLQDQYRQMLLKNDTIIQQSIHRQLRKRDFQAQNNYLRDVAQYQTVKKQKSLLQETINQSNHRIAFLQKENKRLTALLQVESQKLKDLEQAFQNQTQVQKTHLFDKYKDLAEAETNTDKNFVPIAMPIDMNLMSEVVSLKQFLVEKIVFRFMDFFQQSTGSEAKKSSKSLLVFKNCLQQMKETNPEIRILLFVHTNLQKIIKIYCPAMESYPPDLTVKDQFIKKTLIQCDNISNQPQRLFRILDLFFRIKNPLNHLHAQITPAELKAVQAKLLTCLKKNFG